MMTPFEIHVRKYRPESVTAKLSFENEKLWTALRTMQAARTRAWKERKKEMTPGFVELLDSLHYIITSLPEQEEHER